LADIARALECPIADLVSAAAVPAADKGLVTAQANVYAIRESLLEADLDERPMTSAPPLAELERETELAAALRSRCDYVGASRRLPDLIRGLHAAAHGRDRAAALGMMVSVGHVAADSCRYVGFPGEGWVGAEWVRRAAEDLDDSVMTGYASFVRAHAATGAGAYNRGYSLASRAADELAQRADQEHAAEMLGLLLLTSGHTAYAIEAAGGRRRVLCGGGPARTAHRGDGHVWAVFRLCWPFTTCP